MAALVVSPWLYPHWRNTFLELGKNCLSTPLSSISSGASSRERLLPDSAHDYKLLFTEHLLHARHFARHLTPLITLVVNKEKTEWLRFPSGPKLYQNFSEGLADILTLFILHRDCKSSRATSFVNVVQYVDAHCKLHGAQVYPFEDLQMCSGCTFVCKWCWSTWCLFFCA